MLKTSTASKKYFHFTNRCHYYEDLHAGIKEENRGFFKKTISPIKV